MKRTEILLIILAILFVVYAIGNAEERTLQWDPNTEPDLAGYRVYYGHTQGGPYVGAGISWNGMAFVSPVDVGNVTEVVFDLPDGDWYFVATAYDNEIPSLESDYSNEVFVKISNPPNPPSMFRLFIQTVMNWIRGWFSGFSIS